MCPGRSSEPTWFWTGVASDGLDSTSETVKSALAVSEQAEQRVGFIVSFVVGAAEVGRLWQGLRARGSPAPIPP